MLIASYCSFQGNTSVVVLIVYVLVLKSCSVLHRMYVFIISLSLGN